MDWIVLSYGLLVGGLIGGSFGGLAVAWIVSKSDAQP